jgi:hypothetical protein
MPASAGMTAKAVSIQVESSKTVMAGLVPAIQVDPRDKPGDDDWGELYESIPR